MRVFITGGCGFIGSHLAEFHLAQGDEVHVLDNLTTGSINNIAAFQKHPAFQFDQGDILTWAGLENAVRAAQRIYHLAAIVGMFKVISDPLSVVDTNILGCQHLLQTIYQSSSKPVVIIMSSSSVYGNSPKPLLNENDNLIFKPPTHPLSTYAVSKMTNEVMALAYYHSSQVPIIITRLFNTVGPRQTGQYGMVVPRFVKQSSLNEPFTIFGDGTQTRSFCDVRDAVAALNLLAQNPEAVGQIINVGNDYEISINDLADLVASSTGNPKKTTFIPYKEAYGVEYTDITQRRPDLSKLFQLTGFRHKWPLQKTVSNLISIYKKEFA